MPEQIPQVGAPDPEKRTSPIYDEDEDYALDLDAETGVCYFNDVAFPLGQYVRSGTELLHCEGSGLWVRRGEMRSAEEGGPATE